MIRRLIKVGNSSAMIIPPALLDILNIDADKNYEAKISFKDNQIIISDFKEIKNG